MAKEKTIKAVAKYSRTYSSGFRTMENKEYDVPSAYMKRYPNHFIIRMTDKKETKKKV